MTIAILAGLLALASRAQVATEVAWQRCLGGSDIDWGSYLTKTSDGGFVCIGWSMSNDGDATGNHGGNDVLVAKLDANGALLWKHSFGGSSEDQGYDCLEAGDGSIMVVGSTYSLDGDVTSNHGGSDIWILKLSSQGNTIWSRTYGGSNTDGGGRIQELPGGGFVVHGITTSDDGDVVGFHPGGGVQDHWVFSIDAMGNLLWSRALGGSGADVGVQLIQVSDGGFLINFSYTESSDGEVTNYHGAEDAWLVKLSATGAIEWSRTIGGSQQDVGSDVLELGNGDFMLLGETSSSDGDILNNHGMADVFLARVSSAGSLLWMRTYGGSLGDDCRKLLATSDGGFLLSGSSLSSDGDLTANSGDGDAWVMKVDQGGTPQWHRSFGGSMSEWAYAQEVATGGYLLSGLTFSDDGDIVGSHGGEEIWFAKITGTGDLEWQRCLGGSAVDWGYVLAQTSDNGYVAFGFTESNDGDVSGNHGQRDIWIAKLKVAEPAEPLHCALYVPTAFSPNASGKNDAHCLYGTDCIKSMLFSIYDRWGNKVFESTDPNTCWDGSYNGQALDPAVFVYRLSATLMDGEQVERQGNITLTR